MERTVCTEEYKCETAWPARAPISGSKLVQESQENAYCLCSSGVGWTESTGRHYQAQCFQILVGIF